MELRNCGNNACIIGDVDKIYSAGVGDFFFIKGLQYPHEERRGLVHKSPEKAYHPDGRVVNRLLLKVDLPGNSMNHAAMLAMFSELAVVD